MEHLLRDLPSIFGLEQSEEIRHMGVGAREFPRPVLDFKVNDGDGFENVDAGETRFNVRRGTVFVDPAEQLLDRTGQEGAAAVANDCGVGMEAGTHQLALTSPSARDVVLHCSDDGVIFGYVINHSTPPLKGVASHLAWVSS
jgi:hypothetical protein